MAAWKRFGLVGAILLIVVGLVVFAVVWGRAPSTASSGPEHRVNPAVILGAFVFFGMAYLLTRDARQSKDRNEVRAATWWQIPATVTQSELRSISPADLRRRSLASKEAGFDRPRDYDGVQRRYFVADIRYEYVVGVQRFVGDRVGVSEDVTRSGAAATVARYAPGDRVTAWVDPSEPSRAVLDLSQVYTTVRAMWAWLALLVAVGVLFLVLGTGVIAVNVD